MEVPTKQLTPREIAEEAMVGRTKTFLLPSGYEVTIREMNADDEDIISNASTGSDLTNFRIYLSGIIINTNLPMAKNGKLDIEGAKELLLRDKYFIILMSRIHSYGNIVKIPFNWGNNTADILYEENLDRYVWDYNKPFPELGSENYDAQMVKPYPANAYSKQTIQLASGKVLRFHFLDGNSEVKLLKQPIDQQTRSSEIRARDLELRMDEEYIKVENFRFFNRMEMAELYKFFRENDTSFSGLTELENPNKKGEIEYVSVLQSNDFFYPGEI